MHKHTTAFLRRKMVVLNRILYRELSHEETADIYAQLMCYGFFAARCHLLQFSRPSAVQLLSSVAPLLASVYADADAFDDILEDLTTFLSSDSMAHTLDNYPVDLLIHGYEAFLAAYAPARRQSHGIFYTPRAVTGYIVRSIDCLLRRDFGVADGLAGLSSQVALLDPCLGAGTFLQAVIEQMTAFCGENWPACADQVIPSLYGCDLLPAPLLLAHLCLGLQLAATDARPHLVCQDALAGDGNVFAGQPPVVIVLGNPPYAGHSQHTGRWISELLHGHDPHSATATGSYFHVDGLPLREHNAKWLHDDYVKFFRLAQWHVEQAGAGMVAVITNHGFLSNPTFCGMRHSLLETFDELYLLDLHGSSKKNRLSPDGTRDENIFPIQSGVAISLLVKRPQSSNPPVVRHAELWGTADSKLDWLAAHDVATTPWSDCPPQSPLYLFTPRQQDLTAEYQRGWDITRVMPVHSLGVLSKRDGLVVDFNQAEVLRKIRRFADRSVSDTACATEFGLPLADKDRWDLPRARAAVSGQLDDEKVRPYLYRPFDERAIYYDPAVIARPNTRVLGHLEQPNLALLLGRQGEATGALEWDLLLVTDKLADHNIYRRGGGAVFPLYLYDGSTRMPNLAPDFVTEMAQRLEMTFLPEGCGDRRLTFGPEDILHYCYAVFHAPGYRTRYADHLASAFPRLPLTGNPALFAALCIIGERLVTRHLQRTAEMTATFPVNGDNHLRKVRYEPADGRVWINATQYFDSVAPATWDYHIGGYQVCRKWLKDRLGRRLSEEEVRHYRRVVTILTETLRIMDEIDRLVDTHGGWPL